MAAGAWGLRREAPNHGEGWSSVTRAQTRFTGGAHPCSRRTAVAIGTPTPQGRGGLRVPTPTPRDALVQGTLQCSDKQGQLCLLRTPPVRGQQWLSIESHVPTVGGCSQQLVGGGSPTAHTFQDSLQRWGLVSVGAVAVERALGLPPWLLWSPRGLAW